MENGRFEDVLPVEHGAIPRLCMAMLKSHLAPVFRRLEIELFERSGVCQIKKSSTSNQTSVFKEQVIFHSFSSVESVATTLRDDINDNSSRVFLGLIVPCLSKCALGPCAACDSDVGNFPSESRRKDPN